MASPTQPMEGIGAATDMLSGTPAQVQAEAQRSEREAAQQRRQQQRQQAEFRLLHDLTQGQGGEIVHRLVAETLADLHAVVETNADPEMTWARVRMLKIRLQVLSDTLGGGARVVDTTARTALIDILARMVGTAFPPSPPTAQTEG